MTKSTINKVVKSTLIKKARFLSIYSQLDPIIDEVLATSNTYANEITVQSVIYLTKPKIRAVVLGIGADNNTIIISPISKYAAPATDKEISLADGNMVIATWNSMTCRIDNLSPDEYIVVSKLSNADFKILSIHYNMVFNCYEFPAESVSVLGAPYSSYDESEKSILSKYLNETLSNFSGCSNFSRMQTVMKSGFSYAPSSIGVAVDAKDAQVDVGEGLAQVTNSPQEEQKPQSGRMTKFTQFLREKIKKNAQSVVLGGMESEFIPDCAFALSPSSNKNKSKSKSKKKDKNKETS